jgi:putative LysE/RhtB family amino acid efflux pump
MIGVAIAAPVGPIGMLCIRKTLELGIKGAILVGLGAALADSCYGLIAALGLSAISHFLVQKAIVIKIIGGVFLFYLAYKEIKSSGFSGKVLVKSKTGLKLVFEMFFLTLTNPMTILSFVGIFASISGGPATPLASLMMVLGIFLGSMSWWLVLGSIVVKIKHKLPDTWLHRIQYLSAFILAGFGAFAVISGLIAIS